MLGVGIVLSVLVGGLRLLFLLESPSYYLAKGKYKEASKAASQLLEKTINLEPDFENSEVSKTSEVSKASESLEISETADKLGVDYAEIEHTDSSTSAPTPSSVGLSYRDLFSSTYIKQTALASIPWFLQDISTYGIGIFTPTIIAALTFASSDSLVSDSFLLREIASAQGAAIVNVFLVVGFLTAVLLVDRVGRIPLQVVGFIGMAAGLWILSFAGTSLAWLFVGFIVFNLTMNIGPNSTTFLLSGELFPPEIRASGAGLAGGIAKLGAVLGTLGLPILQEHIGVVGVVRSLAVICLIAATVTYRLHKASQVT